MQLSPSHPFAGSYPRRELLRVGGISALASCLPGLLASQALGSSALTAPVNGRLFGRAKQVIMLFLSGGPPQHETFDPKPLAPVEIRGPFKPISTNVPGIQFCELLPRTAARADRLADGRQVQDLGAADVVGGHVARLHQRGRGILAQIVELVTGGGVGDETDAGRRAVVALHAGRIDTLGLPQV